MTTNQYQKLKAARRRIGLKNVFGRIIIFFVTSVVSPVIPHSIPYHYLFPTGNYQKEIQSRKCKTIIVFLDIISAVSVFFMYVISGHITDLILPVVDSSGFLFAILAFLVKLSIFTLLCFILSNPLINLKNAVSFISGVNRYKSLTSIFKVIKQSTGESLLSFKNLFRLHTEQYSWYNEYNNRKKLHESLREFALEGSVVRPVVKQGRRYEQLLERYEYVIPDFFGKDTKIDPEEKYIKSIVRCVYSDDNNYLVSGSVDTSLPRAASLASVGTHVTRMFSGVGPDIILMFPVDEYFDDKLRRSNPDPQFIWDFDLRVFVNGSYNLNKTTFVAGSVEMIKSTLGTMSSVITLSNRDLVVFINKHLGSSEFFEYSEKVRIKEKPYIGFYSQKNAINLLEELTGFRVEYDIKDTGRVATYIDYYLLNGGDESIFTTDATSILLKSPILQPDGSKYRGFLRRTAKAISGVKKR
jgi:hypothetical protein